MEIPSTEVVVPPHLLDLFNQAFGYDFKHCALYMYNNKKENYDDKDIWEVMVNSHSKGMTENLEDLLSDDYIPRKKITWH